MHSKNGKIPRTYRSIFPAVIVMALTGRSVETWCYWKHPAANEAGKCFPCDLQIRMSSFFLLVYLVFWKSSCCTLRLVLLAVEEVGNQWEVSSQSSCRCSLFLAGCRFMARQRLHTRLGEFCDQLMYFLYYVPLPSLLLSLLQTISIPKGI